MEITLEMPVIERCDATECTYNLNTACHAKAITVGDGITPGCDTFMHGSRHVKDGSLRGGVGACKVSGCKHNIDYECGAEQIQVSNRGNNVFCMTYQRN